MTTHPKVVYFLEVDQSKIKIGVSCDLKARLESHRRNYERVYFLGAVAGGEMEEGFCHNRFKHLRVQAAGDTETFFPDPDLCGWIRWLRDRFFTITDEADWPERVFSLPFNEWCPDDVGRRVARCADEENLFAASTDPLDELDWPEPALTADDYYTPPIILDPVRSFMGGFDLDPASCAMANRYVQAKAYYDNSQNGLTRRWKGKVWCNPPFSVYGDFVNKAVEEWHRQEISEMVFLSSMVKLTAHYFQPLIEITRAILIMRGRHNHLGLGESKQSNTGHALLYMGFRTEEFAEATKELGRCFSR